MAKRHRSTRSERAQHLAQWAASGLSAAAFSERLDISPWTLYRWRKDKQATANGTMAESPCSTPPLPMLSPAFAE